MWIADHSRAGAREPEEWLAAPLDGEMLALDSGVPTTMCDATESAGALLLRIADVGGEAWALLGSERLRLNGMPLFAGIALLRDRDEVLVEKESGATDRLFFSTERPATVEVFPGAEQLIRCPRCKSEITTGTPAVRCPQCKVWHHQTDERPCWAYADRCALCDQSTALDGAFRWTPGEL